MAHEAIYEQAPDGGWGAHVPDLPTILVGADTKEEAEVLVQEAIAMYLDDSTTE